MLLRILFAQNRAKLADGNNKSCGRITEKSFFDESFEKVSISHGYLVLVPRIRRAGVDNHLVDLSELAKVLLLAEDLGVRQPGRQAHHKHKVLLDHADVGQVFPILGDLLLLGLIFLALFRLDLGHFFPGQGLEVSRVLRVDGTTRWTVTVPFCPDLVQAETTYLKGTQKLKVEFAF